LSRLTPVPPNPTQVPVAAKPKIPYRLMNRRIALVCVASIACAVGVDAFLIEPDRIEVTYHHVSAPLASPLKIAHLTDIHARLLGGRERRMIDLVNREKPDLIAITGDSIFNGRDFDIFEKETDLPPRQIGGSNTYIPVEPPYDERYAGCIKVLKQLHAPLGVWFVRGNWEHWRPIRDERKFSEVTGVRFLQNASSQIAPGVWIVGVDDALFGSPDLKAALKDVPPTAYKILLFHSPVYFRKAAGQCDLVLAGHTHGGQVYLPFLVRLWLPPGCGEFLAGWYEKEGSRMYVSRGIGTSTVDVRFLCRPELAIFQIGGAGG